MPSVVIYFIQPVNKLYCYYDSGRECKSRRRKENKKRPKNNNNNFQRGHFCLSKRKDSKFHRCMLIWLKSPSLQIFEKLNPLLIKILKMLHYLQLHKLLDLTKRDILFFENSKLFLTLSIYNSIYNLRIYLF